MFYNRIENPFLRGAAEWIVLIAFSVLLFFVLRAFIFRTAKVDGNSMVPTLEHGDMIILNRIVYYISTPKAGDIVAFPYAENPSEHFIKRVIGVPGDTVDLIDGFFYVNGVRLDDEFSDEQTPASGNAQFPITVEENHYFVLGDNRNSSQDSRFSSVGCIPRNEIVGRASVRYWPLGRVGSVR